MTYLKFVIPLKYTKIGKINKLLLGVLREDRNKISQDRAY